MEVALPTFGAAPLLDCVSSKAANGSAALAVGAGFVAVLEKGSKAESIRDELVEPVKSPNASSPPPSASNALLLAGEGAANASNTEEDGTDGGSNASNGELLCVGFAGEAAAVMSLNGSRETVPEKPPVQLLGAGTSRSNGDESTGVGWFLLSDAGAGASNPNGLLSCCGGPRPIRSSVAVVVLALDARKFGPGGGGIVNELNFGTGRGVCLFDVAF